MFTEGEAAASDSKLRALGILSNSSAGMLLPRSVLPTSISGLSPTTTTVSVTAPNLRVAGTFKVFPRRRLTSATWTGEKPVSSKFIE